MDFLDNIVLPQSSEHMVLLRYLLGLTSVLLIPYLSALFGMLGYSLFYGRKGKKDENPVYLRFAKELVSIITLNKSMAVALGVVPFVSAIFCYAQLLHLSDAQSVIGYLTASFIFFIISLLMIYSYRHSLHIKDLFAAVSDGNQLDEYTKNEVREYKNKANVITGKAGIWGFIFLIISTYLFIAAIQLASDSFALETQPSFFGVIFSLNAISYYLFFTAVSFALSSAIIIYYYFRPSTEEKYQSADFNNYVKKISLRNGLVFTILLPALIVLNLIFKPGIALTTSLFATLLLSLFLIMIISNMFYTMIKASEVKYGSSILLMFVILFIFVIAKDQMAFSSATKLQFQKLTQNYTEYENNLKAELGIDIAPISGEDIYNGRCIACHQFDQKLVGPPYKEVLPKYDGKMDQLIDFILNPVKVNPEYPAMPNQGLKPNEAKAVAEYLIQTYRK